MAGDACKHWPVGYIFRVSGEAGAATGLESGEVYVFDPLTHQVQMPVAVNGDYILGNPREKSYRSVEVSQQIDQGNRSGHPERRLGTDI